LIDFQIVRALGLVKMFRVLFILQVFNPLYRDLTKRRWRAANSSKSSCEKLDPERWLIPWFGMRTRKNNVWILFLKYTWCSSAGRQDHILSLRCCRFTFYFLDSDYSWLLMIFRTTIFRLASNSDLYSISQEFPCSSFVLS